METLPELSMPTTLPFFMLMHGHDLYDHLDGSALIPTLSTTSGTNTTLILLIRFDSIRINSSRMLLWRLLTLPLLPQLLLQSHPNWDSLHTAYANKSHTRIFNLRDQLVLITKDTIPITEYLQRIRTFSDELATTGASVSNSELIVKILSGLGPKFCEISATI
uniref:Uncharacterized protein n=1 Tax=Nicotiana tabacum TaxID=4097 RepID=A0A1S4A5X7_TOBAC|nr:PREDICTED: uncharacterized protein LOC107794108 [Nicotiana tabacum]